jgi:aspartyl-tRNA(Asn)/glutamyl-tRNA(Gln) amidotransferase subunit B
MMLSTTLWKGCSLTRYNGISLAWKPWFSSCGANDFVRYFALCPQRRCFHQDALQVEYDRDSGKITLLTTENNGANAASTSQLFFQTIIGLEIHAQLDIPTKLFSSSPTATAYTAALQKSSKSCISSEATANTLVSLFDAGYPGVLPSLSESAVHKALLASSALNCQIHPVSRFERKHYTYADLPLGYQITQQRWPVASNGHLKCRNFHQPLTDDHVPKHGLVLSALDISYFTVGIHRIQLEQDTGKTILSSFHKQLIDLNRAGCALIEIVFLPDIRSAHQAAAVVSTLQQLLKHIGVCDGKMEDGSLRCDLNISIAPITTASTTKAQHELNHSRTKCDGGEYASSLPVNCGKRVEVKNLNSIRQIILATEYEACRQAKVYHYRYANNHGNVTKGTEEEETRTFDPSLNQTIKIRSKKGAVDYRFLPEPDLPPLILDEHIINQWVQEQLPELPEMAVSRLKEQYGLKDEVACVLVSNHPPVATIQFFEEAVKYCLSDLQQHQQKEDHIMQTITDKSMKGEKDVGPAVANWLCNDLFALIKKTNNSEGGVGEVSYSIGKRSSTCQDFLISPRQLGSLVAMILDETIPVRAGKNLLSLLCSQEYSQKIEEQSQPRDIADQRGWKLIKDDIQLQKICRQVMDEHKQQLAQYLAAVAANNNRTVSKIEKFLMGKAMSASQGNAHPDLLLHSLRQALSERSIHQH